MNNHDQLDKELTEYFCHEEVEDLGFSEQLYSQINQRSKQEHFNGRIIVSIFSSIILLSAFGYFVFSLASPGVIEYATFAGLAVLTTYFWLEPEI